MEHKGINLYQQLTDAEKMKIQEKAQGLTGLLSIWASQYSIIRTNRAVPVAALVATVLPDLPVNLSLLVGKLILFIFAVDDIADERLLSYDDFNKASTAWETLARDGTTNQPFLRDLWVSRLRSLCDAMAKEYEYGLRYTAGGKEMLPEFSEYMQGGIHSVGFPFWGTSILILFNEPDLQNKLDAINEIILQTGAAIRLYNDIRTYEKEVQENNINAITIVENGLARQQPGLSPSERFEQAKQTVLELAYAYARGSKELAGQLGTDTGKFEILIVRIIDFHAFFYGSSLHHHDYHTISSDDTFSMIHGE